MCLETHSLSLCVASGIIFTPNPFQPLLHVSLFRNAHFMVSQSVIVLTGQWVSDQCGYVTSTLNQQIRFFLFSMNTHLRLELNWKKRWELLNSTDQNPLLPPRYVEIGIFWSSLSRCALWSSHSRKVESQWTSDSLFFWKRNIPTSR